MRLSRVVAIAALTAALALGALPGIAGSAGPTPASVLDPSTFQSVQVPAFATTDLAVEPLDASFRAAGGIDATTTLTETGNEPNRIVPNRPDVSLPAAHGGAGRKPPPPQQTGETPFFPHRAPPERPPPGPPLNR